MSVVWQFFEICDNDASMAKCLLCKSVYSRGKGTTSKFYTTSTLLCHLKTKHFNQYNDAVQKKQSVAKRKQEQKDLTSLPALKASNDDKDKPTPSKQLKIEDLMTSTTPLPLTSRIQIEFKYEIMEWLVDAGLPYTTVDNERLRHIFEKYTPRLTLLSESHFRQALMPEMYHKVKAEVTRRLAAGIEFFSITTDMWTSSSMDAYMAVTVHFVDKNTWERRSVVLDCLPFDDEHTAENIADALRSVLHEHGLRNKLHLIVRDNAANVVKAMIVGGFTGVGCFLHAMHLIVTKSIDAQRSVINLLAKIRQVSKACNTGNGKRLLQRAQKKLEAPDCVLLLDEPTRWSSTYQMTARFEQQKRVIKEVFYEYDKLGQYALTKSEWELLSELNKILAIFAESVTVNEKEDSCISEQLAEAKLLLKKIKKESFKGIGTFKDELIAKIKQYFYGDDDRLHFGSIELNENYSIASLLDPRFKKMCFTQMKIADGAERQLVDKVTDLLTEVSNVQSTPVKALQSNDQTSHNRYELLAEDDDEGECEQSISAVNSVPSSQLSTQPKKLEQTAYEKAKAIVSNYLAEERITSCPLEFWRKNCKNSPELAKSVLRLDLLMLKLALKYLSPPLSSVSSEREFKTARNIANGDRNRLLPENVRKLLFLKHNLKALGYESYTLPSVVAGGMTASANDEDDVAVYESE